MRTVLEIKRLTSSTWRSPYAAPGTARTMDFQLLTGTSRNHLSSTFISLFDIKSATPLCLLASWWEFLFSLEDGIPLDAEEFQLEHLVQCFQSSQRILSIPSPCHLKVNPSSLPPPPAIRIASHCSIGSELVSPILHNKGEWNPFLTNSVSLSPKP